MSIFQEVQRRVGQDVRITVATKQVFRGRLVKAEDNLAHLDSGAVINAADIEMVGPAS